MKYLYLIIIYISYCFGNLKGQTLAERLDALLNEEVLKTSELGLTVFDLTTGESLYRYQDEKLYRPASTEKVITSVTALARLGTDYTMNTRLCHSGRIENDTLKGNLYLIGGFDPEFMEVHLDSLVQAVVQSGIRYIADTLVADVSMMDSVYWGPGWSWDDAPYSFQPYLSPLMLNRGCVKVTVTPTLPDSLPTVECEPTSDYYQVRNEAVSRNPQAGKLSITRNWLEQGNVITVSGNVNRKTSSSLSIYPSHKFFLHVFLERLSQQGVKVKHQAWSVCPQDSVQPLFTLRRPLQEVLKQALKESDNLCAESMFYHLALQDTLKQNITAEDGTKAIYAFMKTALGFNPENYKIADGSGVSLYNYVSPRLLLEYLKYAYYHREVFLPFYDSLPIAGIDGTLKYRMKKTPAYRNVRAKTGSVTGVSSLAGYAKAGNGHQLTFVIINQNVMKLAKARAFQDKICSILSQ
ncbi:MAG: D-alanyl-D-alanine carboxypeptidase/D-alanyl-D-alanine-endopeptidase [Bacteroides sp.]|nr:D-alanyl-D-alanine carboxypeptidase/D-alanyl-D-alanine-endopeptidase [Bacteroides sp.]